MEADQFAVSSFLECSALSEVLCGVYPKYFCAFLSARCDPFYLFCDPLKAHDLHFKKSLVGAPRRLAARVATEMK